MDLVQEVMQQCRVDAEHAEMALGTVFTASRFGMNSAAFDALKQGIPEVQGFLSRTAAASARTSEIVALTSPASVTKALSDIGLDADAVAKLQAIVRAAATAGVAAEYRDRVLAALDKAVP